MEQSPSVFSTNTTPATTFGPIHVEYGKTRPLNFKNERLSDEPWEDYKERRLNIKHWLKKYLRGYKRPVDLTE